MNCKHSFLALVAALVVAIPAASLQATMIVDDFASPGTAVGIPQTTYITQSGLTDNVPGNMRGVYHQQTSGAFSNMIVGSGTIFTNNYSGTSYYLSDYGYLVTGSLIGNLAAEGQDRFRLTLTNDVPTRGQGTMYVQIYNTASTLVEQQFVAIPQVGGVQSVDIPFSSFTVANLASVATVRLFFVGFPLTDYSQFSINRFETFGVAVPEPSSLAMLAFGGIFVWFVRGRRVKN